jgi:hypothetical protein
MGQNGKGSRQRPKSVDQKTWNKNYERIFGTKSQKVFVTKKKNSGSGVDKPIV